MNGLYMIDVRIRQLEEEFADTYDEQTGEIIDEKAAHDLALELEALDMEKADAIEGAALIRQEKLREAESIKAEIDRLDKMKKAAERDAERLKRAITISLNGDKLKTDKISISYRKSEAVEITDEGILPANYWKVEKKPMKAEIKKDIKAGKDISGAKLVKNINTIIK